MSLPLQRKAGVSRGKLRFPSPSSERKAWKPYRISTNEPTSNILSEKLDYDSTLTFMSLPFFLFLYFFLGGNNLSWQLLYVIVHSSFALVHILKNEFLTTPTPHCSQNLILEYLKSSQKKSSK